MASSLDFVQFVCDQLSDAGTITFKRMFGEFGIYCGGKYFAAICDDRFLVKVTDAGSALLPDCPREEPYPGGSPMLLIENLENREQLAALALATCAALPAPRPKKKKASQ